MVGRPWDANPASELERETPAQRNREDISSETWKEIRAVGEQLKLEPFRTDALARGES